MSEPIGEEKLSALDRFSRMLRPSGVSIQSHGSTVRPRHAAVLAAALVLGASFHAQALAEAPHASKSGAGITASHKAESANHIFTEKDSILSKESRSQLGRYSIRTQTELTPQNEKLDSTSAMLDIKKSVIFKSKMTCDLIMVPFPDGYLVPGVVFPEREKTGNKEVDIELAQQDLDDRKYLDLFFFYHEDSHCDAAPWSSPVTPDSKDFSKDKNLFNSSSDALASEIKKVRDSALAMGSTVANQTLSNYKPDDFSKILHGERYSDTRGSLHVGHRMLVEEGLSFEKYERVMKLAIYIRDNEAGLQKEYKLLNNHNTKPVIIEAINMVRDAHSNGEAGFKKLYGDSSLGSLNEDQKDALRERTGDISRQLTIASMGSDKPQGISDIINQYKVYLGQAPDAKKEVIASVGAQPGAKNDEVYSQVSRLRDAFQSRDGNQSFERMR